VCRHEQLLGFVELGVNRIYNKLTDKATRRIVQSELTPGFHFFRCTGLSSAPLVLHSNQEGLTGLI